MKTLKNIFLALGIMFCASVAHAQLKPSEAEVTFKTSIECNGCKAKVEKNIPFEKGVEDLRVNVEEKTVYIKYRKDKTDVEKLQKAIQKLGYTAEPVVEEKK